MKGKRPAAEASFLIQDLGEMLDPQQELYLLSQEINWSWIESELSVLYSSLGRPSKPIRLMVSLLLLKHLKNLGDETVVQEWQQNPYFQFFSGEVRFQWKLPVDPTDLVKFRQRIGESGIEKILKLTIDLNGDRALEKEMVADTTVEEKQVTFPTDAKLQCKVIKHCRQIAKKEGLSLRQSYQKVLKSLIRALHNPHHPRRRKAATAARRKIKTIAGRLWRELLRKLPQDKRPQYADRLMIFQQVLSQKKKDTDKIYSLHEPQIHCISKGKEHKPYEFGNKVSLMICKQSGVVVGAQSVGNQYDGHTLEKGLKQVELLTGRTPQKVIVDRGYRGKQQVGETRVMIPSNQKRKQTHSQAQKMRKLFRRRAAIEPRIGHLKHHHRLLKNFYKGEFGDRINVMLAAAAYNLRLKALFSCLTFLNVFIPAKQHSSIGSFASDS